MAVKKILIVEDDEAISNMYQTKLKQGGYEVLSAFNGADGLSMAKKEKPDLILLDVILPQLDGFAVLEELKEGKDTAKILVVMLTNLSTSEDQAKAKQLGADAYLVKASLTPTEMGATVAKILEDNK
jgi:DNA-binding response OmpR family regulator